MILKELIHFCKGSFEYNFHEGLKISCLLCFQHNIMTVSPQKNLMPLSLWRPFVCSGSCYFWGGVGTGGGCIFSYLFLLKFTLPNLFHPFDDVVSVPGLCCWLFLYPLLRPIPRGSNMLYFLNSVSSYAPPSLPLVVLFVQAPVTEEGAGIVLVCQPLLTHLMGERGWAM